MLTPELQELRNDVIAKALTSLGKYAESPTIEESDTSSILISLLSTLSCLQ